MISALVFSSDQFLQCHSSQKILSSFVVDVDNDSLRDSLVDALYSYTDNDVNICLGLSIRDSGLTAMDVSKEYSGFLPIKTGDVILLVEVEDDECIYFNLNDLNQLIYFNKGDLSDLVHYQNEGDDLTYCMFSNLDFSSYRNGYLVNDNWDITSINSNASSLSSLINDIKQLSSTDVWGN